MPRPRLSEIKIDGPLKVKERNSAKYTCTARYTDGSTRDVTSSTTWSVNSTVADINRNGTLDTYDVTRDTDVAIKAVYRRRTDNRTVRIEDVDTTEGNIVIDPITRIEGHLRIEVETAGGKVTDAWSSGTLFRGIEVILKGRRPEDAWLFTQRLCGVCTYVHGSSSVRCVEDAAGVRIPDNARIIRNLLMGGQFLHDHIIHFYHLHALDWVDITKALEAKPADTEALAKNLSPDAPTIDFQAARDRLETFVSSGQLGPFANAYWGHSAYLLDPAENLLLAAHYLEALKLQARTARLHAIFGAKNPHVQSLRVGGVTCRYDVTDQRISEFRSLLQETRDFIDQFYVPDVKLLAEAYPEWAAIGGNNNFLAYGEFPLSDNEPGDLFFPRGAIFNRGGVEAVDLSQIQEHVQHSWYQNSGALHPSAGNTVPSYNGLDIADRYSWLKAPRYEGEPMEVGPLARVLVAYKTGKPEALVKAVDQFLSDTGLKVNDLYSTLGRTAARALETQTIAYAMEDWLDSLTPGGATYQTTPIPLTGKGVGLNEAPRGALGHWIDIQSQQIGNYQMVVPSTWNFGPRCENDLPGPAESALLETPVIDSERPLEILRVVHSLDPCIACAVHVIDPHNDEVYTVRVR